MTAGVLAAAADAGPGRWSVQPSLAVFVLVVVLLAGFYLGRASDGIHAAWLDLWGTAAVWAARVLVLVGLGTVLWLLGRWWIGKHGGG